MVKGGKIEKSVVGAGQGHGSSAAAGEVLTSTRLHDPRRRIGPQRSHIILSGSRAKDASAKSARPNRSDC